LRRSQMDGDGNQRLAVELESSYINELYYGNYYVTYSPPRSFQVVGPRKEGAYALTDLLNTLLRKGVVWPEQIQAPERDLDSAFLNSTVSKSRKARSRKSG
jgi:hypothetical protein